MDKLNGFYQGTEYHSPERKIGFLSKLLPTLSFYIREISIVYKAS